MDRSLTLDMTHAGQIDRGIEQVFRGRNRDDDVVHLHVATSEWVKVREAHADREDALGALETLARVADWLPNPQDGGWTVRLKLPRVTI